MEKYSPMMELAPRDIVSKAIITETELKRGINGSDYVYLDLRHLGKEKILSKLPFIYDSVKRNLNIDCTEKPIPIRPTAHYSIGGIPTNNKCEVYSSETNTVTGLYAAGECACLSLHGANRLGCNSLLECGRDKAKNSKNIIKACELAKEHKIPVVGLSGFDGGKLNEIADAKILVRTTFGEYEAVESVHGTVLHMITKYFKNYFDHSNANELEKRL